MGTVEGGAARARGRARPNTAHTPGGAPPPPPQVRTCGYLALLADGMGGHGRGEVASDAASDGLYARFYAEPPAAAVDLPALLRAGIRDAEAAVRAATGAADARAPGTTLVAAAIRDDLLFVANVGDSRAYLARDGAAFQLTRDHSLVAAQVAAGLLTPAEAAASGRRNLLTQALGPAGPSEADVFVLALQPEDRVILCSDGVHGQLAPADFAALAGGDPRSASQALVDRALARGATDNVSAVVLWYRAGDDTAAVPAAAPIATPG
jgi:serine/threonine protein phosphatase PrpC